MVYHQVRKDTRLQTHGKKKCVTLDTFYIHLVICILDMLNFFFSFQPS